MWGHRITHTLRDSFVGRVYQSLAILFCVLLGLGMIANTQLAGEAEWFWYARLFHSGAKLYADLHLPLQPLMVLEMDAWMQMFGIKCLVTEIPAVIHLLILCFGLFLTLRESDWPDWQKAIVIAGSFVFWVAGYSYRFDDYHVTTESFILYSLLLLLLMARATSTPRQIALALALGILCGFTATSRLNDGAALLAATSICLLVLARTRKLMVTGVFVAASVLTMIVVVKSTGDSFSDYLASTLTKAVGSKGGAGSMLADPFLLFINALRMLHGSGWLFLAILAITGAGVLMQRYGKNDSRDIVVGQLCLGLAALVFSSVMRQLFFSSGLIDFAIPCIVVVTYLLAIIVLTRFMAWIFSSGKTGWDTREILILFPLAELASNSATAGAQPFSGYYAQMVLLLLLVPLLLPLRRQVAWANASFLTILISIAFTGAISKEHTPYFWDNVRVQPMFVDHEWYRHPVYGPMYVQTDLLRFSTSICAEISGDGSQPELLSIPFPYPNYFCNTPPWHGYVQTFFDTTTRSTMEKLLTELQTAPPQWIVYQRQLKNLNAQERIFNHGGSLGQRDLDTLIMQKIATGQWKLVDFQHYQYGDGWYVIRTRP